MDSTCSKSAVRTGSICMGIRLPPWRYTRPMPDSEHEDHAHHHRVPDAADPDEAKLRALESELVRQGYVDRAALDEIIDTYKHKVGSRNGAKVVARAWLDPEFRAWLLTDATAAIASLGYTGRQGEHMV